MSMTFTKLFSSITESTVWCESSDIRIVWIAMLAMADKHGRVWGSIPGLANRARVPVESAREAIHAFLSPDKDSRTKDFEGRRIREIDGGWALLNYGKYRAIRDEEERRAYKAMKQRQYRAEGGQKNPPKNPPKQASGRGKTSGQSGHALNNVDSGGHNADAEADALKTFNPPSPLKSTQPDAAPPAPPLGSLNPIQNPEIKNLVDLVLCASPWGVSRHLRTADVTPTQRVYVLTAAKVEMERLGKSLPNAVRSMLAMQERQAATSSPDELKFLGGLKKYYAEYAYRVDPEKGGGNSNGRPTRNPQTKGERTLAAVLERRARRAQG